jgi:hypothetical protein
MKISGDPTYASLTKLEKECKANRKSVTSTLGGGLQGHLGLVSNALTYSCLTGLVCTQGFSFHFGKQIRACHTKVTKITGTINRNET